jgi:ribulose kinase
VYEGGVEFFEQSSGNIWNAVCSAVKTAFLSSKVDALSIKGIGFDATCSLTALDANFDSVSVSKDRERAKNIIMWYLGRMT